MHTGPVRASDHSAAAFQPSVDDAGADRATRPVVTLPAGRHGLSREHVESSQRDRLIAAMIEVTGEVGYGKVTVEEVAKRARTAKRTFYRMFSDKEACFVEAYDFVMTGVLGQAAAALDPADHPLVRIDRGISAFLAALAADPNAARLGMIECLGAGPLASAHRARAVEAFADVLITSHDQARQTWHDLEPLTPTAALAVIGAINEPVTMVLLRGSAESLPRMHGELTEILAHLLFPPLA